MGVKVIAGIAAPFHNARSANGRAVVRTRSLGNVFENLGLGFREG
jgi:hypothetical protein